jgi:hypothetical protein
VAFALSFWICSYATIPTMVYVKEHPLWIVFMLELLATALEHMAVVYVIMPLLPPITYSTGFLTVKVKPKSDHTAKAPTNQTVLHAALTFSVLHWLLWRAFGTEMNPAVTVIIAYLRKRQLTSAGDDTHHHAVDPWHHAIMAIWGQIVGLIVCIIYTLMYNPRR